MNMSEYAVQSVAKFQALLEENDAHIYTYEMSFKYRLENVLKTLQFDDSGITAMVMVKDLYGQFGSAAHIRINVIDNKFDKVLKFRQDLLEVKELIQQSQIVEQMQHISGSIENYFKKADQGISPDMRNFLDDHGKVIDVYTKTLKSSKDFDVLVFSKGKNAVEGSKLELFSPVYVWRDFNSLQAHQHKFEDGVYFCFVDRVFGFVYKNGENFVVVSDTMEYNYLRRHFSDRFIPSNKNNTDAGYYLPYRLLKTEYGKMDVQLYNFETAEAFDNQTTPSVLCDISELPVESLVYVVLMFELLVKKYGFATDLLDAEPITTHGTNHIFDKAIEYKSSQKLITVDELRHGVFHARFPEQSYSAYNTGLEERFSHLVDQRLLNLVKHNGQVFCPDESGRYVPFTEKIKYKYGEFNSTDELKLLAFDLTMVGTPEQLEELRYRVARKNYAAMLGMHTKSYMSEKLPEIRKYLEKKFYDNLENLETIMGYQSIQVPNHLGRETPWSLMVSEQYDAKVKSYPQSQWLRTYVSERDPGSSVLRCYETGSKRFQTIMFRVGSAEQLAFLLNVPVNKLPDPLKEYRYDSFDRHCKLDPVDQIESIWEQRLLEFEVVVSKSHYNSIRKKTNPQYLEKIKATAQL